MKKIPAVILTAVCTASVLSGCSSQSSVPSPHISADNDAVITFKDETYKCRISCLNKNTSSLTFSSPESLSGLCFKSSDGTVSVSLGSLMCKNENLLLPKTSLPARVKTIFDSIASDGFSFTAQHGENYEFSNKDSSVSLLTDKSGDPLRIISGDMKITFYDK